ncbi:hypothetical protein LTR85_001684 [Meristemomyces frigidus]|nr:hypothetical protein LTR85_001684 [Meristemomyces frigidus]
MDNPAISNAFGTIGAVCWSVQLAPQIYLNWRRHSAEGLSSAFMMFWAWAGVPLGVYNIVSGFNIALQVQPQILTALSLTTWIQCYYYQRKWSVRKALTLVLPVACVMAGIEAAVIIALRIGMSRGVHWPLTLMAVLAALFLALGVIEQYLAIYRHRSVVGISFLFCGIDAMGDLTSIIAVIFEPQLSILGLVIYGVELLLWFGVFACGGYYKLLPWIKQQTTRRRESRAAAEQNPDATPATPDASKSIFSRPRSGSNETVLTAITEVTAESTASLYYPDAPANSPDTRSLADDHQPDWDTANLTAKLQVMPGNLTTPPASDVASEHLHSGKAHSGVSIRDFGIAHPKPRRSSALTSGVLRAERERNLSTPTPNKVKENVTPDASDFMEHSIWEGIAEEDVEKALQRLAMLAKDEFKKDRGKSVEKYYSDRLAKLLKGAEIKFDVGALH